MNTIIKLIIFTIIYFIILLFISPTIDHFFTTIDQDKAIKETNFKILNEIIIQLIVVINAFEFLIILSNLRGFAYAGISSCCSAIYL